METTQGIWITDIRGLEGQEARWMPLLTESRRARVERVRPLSGKLELAGAGLLLRHVLGVTDDTQLREDEHGKRSLAAGGPHFNLSHGGHLAVLAGASAPIGVDVEPVGETIPIRIPRRFLLPDELAWLEEQPTGARFAHLWTRLESVGKADGRGLGMGTRTCSLLEDCAGPWQLHTFLYEGHCISLAAGERLDLPVHTVTAEELLK